MEKGYMGYYDKETGNIFLTQLDTKRYFGQGYVPIDNKTIDNLVKEIQEKRGEVEEPMFKHAVKHAKATRIWVGDYREQTSNIILK